VNPEERRKGYGSEALQAAKKLAHQYAVDTIVAIIKPENSVSKRVFQKAGFSLADERYFIVESLFGREETMVDVWVCPIRKASELDHVFVVAEAGSNWQIGGKDQNREHAVQLIEAAAAAGADAIKFQTFRAEKVYAPSAGVSSYLASSGIQKDIRDVLHDLEMAYEDIPYLSNAAKRAGLEFMSTAFSVEDFEAVDPYVSRHKIASYEVALTPLLLRAAHSGKPVYMSTGASNIAEISWAVRTLQEAGCQDLTLLQCTAAYPADPSSMNLRALASLRSIFNLPVGLSDHSLDCLTAPVIAVSLGASVIEKHITLKRSLPGPDQRFSIEPHELKIFVEKIRLAEKMMGSGYKTVLPQEEELFYFAKRAIQALRFIKKDEVLIEGHNIAILRPGNNVKGAHPSFLPLLLGRKAGRDIQGGEGIQLGDVV
jgi:N-acetylneuraminate synthase